MESYQICLFGKFGIFENFALGWLARGVFGQHGCEQLGAVGVRRSIECQSARVLLSEERKEVFR